jgi:hypothetical protein
MTHHAIDYFVTLGRSPGEIKCKSFPLRIDEDSEPITAQDAWKEAITDIILLGPGLNEDFVIIRARCFLSYYY